MKGDCEEEFLRKNSGGKGRRCNGVREEGRGCVRLGDTKAVFLPARGALVDGADEALADEPLWIEDNLFGTFSTGRFSREMARDVFLRRVCALTAVSATSGSGSCGRASCSASLNVPKRENSGLSSSLRMALDFSVFGA